MPEPEPASVPPHDPVNHSQTAPVPSVPPVTERVFKVPLQVLLLEIVTPVGAVDSLFTVTERALGLLVPQLFDAVSNMLPFVPAIPVVTVRVLVPWPPVIVQPEGTLQV